MSLYLPPHVAAAQRKEYAAKVWRNCSAQDPRAQEYTKKLQMIRQGVAMVKAHDTVWDDVPLRPGYYHILLHNEGAPLTVIPVHNGGAYCEPGDWIFEHLARMNMGERRVREEIERQDREEQEAIEKERLDGRARRMERVRDIVNSATRVQVSMNDSVSWSQNVAGRRKPST